MVNPLLVLTSFNLYQFSGNTVSKLLIGIMAIGTDGKPAFAARPCGDNLNVSGTKAGERLTLFDASGRIVRTAAAETGATQISLGGLSAGTYIIMSSKGAVKFVKK